MNVSQIAAYPVSRDYLRLAELAKAQSIICIVSYESYRDVAKTIFSTDGAAGIWHVSARGTGYVLAADLDEFVRQCERVNLEFIEPPAAAASA